MRRFEPNDPRTWADDRVEAFLDGDLAALEAEAFDHALADDADCEAELFLATRIRTELRALPRPACPPAVTRAVIAQARRDVRRARPERLRAWLDRWWTPFWQPSLAMALLLALVFTASLVGRPAAPAADAARVEAALAEAKWTLAYLSQVGRQTGRSVRHDVLEHRVVEPVQAALGTILPEIPKTQN